MLFTTLLATTYKYTIVILLPESKTCTMISRDLRNVCICISGCLVKRFICSKTVHELLRKK